VLGAGVAGLQAIATARRLGAVVQAFDARPAAKEQVESLGARFLFPPRVAEGQGGYARALTPEEEEEMLRFLFDPVADADVVITTAQVPGGRAPILVTAEMVAAMRPGSVVVDLAGESGGNCAVGRPNEEVSVGGVTILTPLNLPASLPAQASELFARNLGAFLELLLQEGGLDTGDPAELCRGDDILEATLVTHGGDVVHQATRARLVTPERS
jgi:NAD(P) transhydrogenase subunit alpha